MKGELENYIILADRETVIHVYLHGQCFTTELLKHLVYKHYGCDYCVVA